MRLGPARNPPTSLLLFGRLICGADASRVVITTGEKPMPAVVVVGTQWGDEGKGKATDQLGQDVDGIKHSKNPPHFYRSYGNRRMKIWQRWQNFCN